MGFFPKSCGRHLTGYDYQCRACQRADEQHEREEKLRREWEREQEAARRRAARQQARDRRPEAPGGFGLGQLFAIPDAAKLAVLGALGLFAVMLLVGVLVVLNMAGEALAGFSEWLRGLLGM